MIIGATGFSWSGSSAITDLLSEFDECQVYDDIEFILPYHPDGLEDLDFHLNKSCSKFLSSCNAIPRFRKVANYLLNKPTRGEIKKLTDVYLNKITQVKWKGSVQGEFLLHNMRCYKYFGKNFTCKLLRRLSPKLCKRINMYPLQTCEFSIQPENFDEATLEYTDAILKSLGLDISGIIVLDQPFAGNDPIKSLKYFRDAKAIIVDRDPRDLYLLAKEYFTKFSYQIPYENIDDFIKYYSNLHKTLRNSLGSPDVLYIRFEELVYDYENTLNKIMLFLGLTVHNRPKKYFIPEKSMVNTRLYMKCEQYLDDIIKIEKGLSEYLFDFDKYKHKYKLQLKNQQVFD